jgi:hypothetical protein
MLSHVLWSVVVVGWIAALGVFIVASIAIDANVSGHQVINLKRPTATGCAPQRRSAFIATQATTDRAATSLGSGTRYTDTASSVSARSGFRRTIVVAIVEVGHGRNEDSENSR